MEKQKNATIRWARESDLDSIVKFFTQCYGDDTIFGDKEFLLYYFKSWDKDKVGFANNLVAINDEGEVVSHYGGLYYFLMYKEVKYPIIWGVNAFTLPEWRGKSFNSKMLDLLKNRNRINGVIGFTADIAIFYKSQNYNVFNSTRFSRHVFISDYLKTLKIINLTNSQEDNHLNELRESPISNSIEYHEIVELTRHNICDFTFDLHSDYLNVLTTYRSSEFLKWRFFFNPFIKYKIYGYVKQRKIIAYIVTRYEKVKETNSKVIRIIDLFGDSLGVEALLQYSIKICRVSGFAYMDFSMFGTIYTEMLLKLGFLKLDNDEFSIFPQVFDPIERRPNNEYLGIYTGSENEIVDGLSVRDVYFTRMDSDRDRIGRRKVKKSN